MEKEDKEILLRDLSARLPYGVKVKTPNDDNAYTLLSLYPNKGIAIIGMPFDDTFATSKVKVEEIKPCLRPMDSMTKEEKKEYNLTKALSIVSYPTLKSFDWLNAHHFDYRGLIKKGLALTVPEGMYTFK